MRGGSEGVVFQEDVDVLSIVHGPRGGKERGGD